MVEKPPGGRSRVHFHLHEAHSNHGTRAYKHKSPLGESPGDQERGWKVAGGRREPDGERLPKRPSNVFEEI
ncbi:hypothetical protein ZHAS_00001970 [Anopheles sinensis]|uniref:Uncharacterized protein n=1 Tax=Anopheles sinensis TaxID=74873 RepID=A0A084VBP5_ANOSI|nr:hypothetical protein ZHAS_00001970 [Anopheles sinensis]